jgi:hypothetical protein
MYFIVFARHSAWARVFTGLAGIDSEVSWIDIAHPGSRDNNQCPTGDTFMHVLRTPDARFADLADYPFAPHYHQLTSDIRLHYVDEGPKDAAPVLMLHGEPTWS